VTARTRGPGGGVPAGIDFAFRLTALIGGEAHARFVHLGLEYDPDPPFDSGSPDRADAALVTAYERRVAALAPGRDEELRRLAALRGYS